MPPSLLALYDLPSDMSGKPTDNANNGLKGVTSSREVFAEAVRHMIRPEEGGAVWEEDGALSMTRSLPPPPPPSFPPLTVPERPQQFSRPTTPPAPAEEEFSVHSRRSIATPTRRPPPPAPSTTHWPQHAMKPFSDRRKKQLSRTYNVESLSSSAFAGTSILMPPDAAALYFSLPFAAKPPATTLTYSTVLHRSDLTDLYSRLSQVFPTCRLLLCVQSLVVDRLIVRVFSCFSRSTTASEPFSLRRCVATTFPLVVQPASYSASLTICAFPSMEKHRLRLERTKAM